MLEIRFLLRRRLQGKDFPLLLSLNLLHTFDSVSPPIFSRSFLMADGEDRPHELEPLILVVKFLERGVVIGCLTKLHNIIKLIFFKVKGEVLNIEVYDVLRISMRHILLIILNHLRHHGNWLE